MACRSSASASTISRSSRAWCCSEPSASTSTTSDADPGWLANERRWAHAPTEPGGLHPHVRPGYRVRWAELTEPATEDAFVAQREAQLSLLLLLSQIRD